MDHGATSTSLATNYTVPGSDGKLLSAIPLKLAIKARPPTIAVVYKMKCKKSGRMKKYIHEIKISFDQQGVSLDKVDITKMSDDILSKETAYLNPIIINRQQVRTDLNFKISLSYFSLF